MSLCRFVSFLFSFTALYRQYYKKSHMNQIIEIIIYYYNNIALMNAVYSIHPLLSQQGIFVGSCTSD